MTKLLDKAFKKASKLPRKAQDALGARLLHELEIVEDEARWDAAFARTQDQLGRWADEALAEIKAGKTTLLDFSRRGK
jgi:hypothetical protein